MTDKPTASQSSADSAFVEMMSELANVTPNKVNPAFKSKYVSLDELFDSVKPVIHKHGFALRQVLVREPDAIGVQTFFHHATGATFDGGCLMIKSENMNPQQVGSALTYIKRQSVQTACCISTDIDDDGAASSRHAPIKAAPAARQTPSLAFLHGSPLVPSAVAYCVKKGWISEGQTLADLPADKVEAIAANSEGFLKAIAR
jgi:hypothetical protein